MVLYYYFIRINFFRLFETSSYSLQKLQTVRISRQLFSNARKLRSSMCHFSTVNLRISTRYCSLLLTFAIKERAHIRFSQNITQFLAKSVPNFQFFLPPLDFCGKILEKFADRSKTLDYGN